MFGGRGEGGVRWEGNRGRGEKESRGRRSEMGGKKGGGGEMEGKEKRGRVSILFLCRLHYAKVPVCLYATQLQLKPTHTYQ